MCNDSGLTAVSESESQDLSQVEVGLAAAEFAATLRPDLESASLTLSPAVVQTFPGTQQETDLKTAWRKVNAA